MKNPTNNWVAVLVALIGLVGVVLTAVLAFSSGQLAATNRIIDATVTAEARLTTVSLFQTAAATAIVTPSTIMSIPTTTPTNTVTPQPPEPTSTSAVTSILTSSIEAEKASSFFIEVLASANIGVEWCTNVAGEHGIHYVRGAYSPFPNNDGCDPKGCWKGSVFVYKNTSADGIFADQPKGEPVEPLLIFGWNDWLQTPAEVESKQLQDRTIHLKRGDCLRFITVDARDAYHWPADNRGSVQLEVLAPVSGLCLGMCWQVDDTARILTWTGPSDGSEDIWQGSDEYLRRVQDGYTTIFANTVPLKVDICVGEIDGQFIAANCTPTVVDLMPGQHTIISAGSQGGFRVGLNIASSELSTSQDTPLVQVGPYFSFRSNVQAETLLLNVVTEGSECLPSIELTVDDSVYVANLMDSDDPQAQIEFIPRFGTAGGWSCNYEVATERVIIPQQYIRVPLASVGINLSNWCYNKSTKMWTPC